MLKTVLNKFPYFKSLNLNFRDCTLKIIKNKYKSLYLNIGSRPHQNREYIGEKGTALET